MLIRRFRTSLMIHRIPYARVVLIQPVDNVKLLFHEFEENTRFILDVKELDVSIGVQRVL